MRVVHDHFVCSPEHAPLFVIFELNNDRTWWFSAIFQLKRIKRLWAWCWCRLATTTLCTAKCETKVHASLPTLPWKDFKLDFIPHAKVIVCHECIFFCDEISGPRYKVDKSFWPEHTVTWCNIIGHMWSIIVTLSALLRCHLICRFILFAAILRCRFGELSWPKLKKVLVSRESVDFFQALLKKGWLFKASLHD